MEFEVLTYNTYLMAQVLSESNVGDVEKRAHVRVFSLEVFLVLTENRGWEN
jgi:hypothetical protein